MPDSRERTRAPWNGVDSAAMTHAGLVRPANEDAVLDRPDLGLWAVADGMGGHAEGALASRTIVEALAGMTPTTRLDDSLAALDARLLAANQDLRDVARKRGLGLIGSTLAALVVRARRYAVLWAGDSRVYLIRRDGRIGQLTHDHTEVQEAVDAGRLSSAEAMASARRHVLTRALGAADRPEVDCIMGEVGPGDVFVLCSDGLTAHLSDDYIASVATAPGRAAARCAALMDIALARGARDNVSVIVLSWPDAGEGETHG